MNLLKEISNDVEGIALIRDWLGDGGEVVPREVAEGRAYTCVYGDHGDPCPKNVEKDWWDRVKSAIADTIKKQLEIKHRMKLRVVSEDLCGMCQACGCAIPTKIWVPTEHIKAHTDLKKFETAPHWCWIRTELEGK